MPKDWGTLGLVYLPEVFEAAGVAEPTADWTWDDLKAAAEAIAATGEYGGFCQNADWARFAPWAFGNGGAYASDDFSGALANSDAVKEAAEFVTSMYADGSIVTAADVGAGWCGEAIGKKLVGMTYEGGWMVNYMRNDFTDVANGKRFLCHQVRLAMPVSSSPTVLVSMLQPSILKHLLPSRFT